MIDAVTITLAILALSILVFAHELGHFSVAKWLGFDVHEFAIGFGPKIFSKKKKDTIFSIRALPLGGFVAFDDEKNIEDGELSFDKKPIWKRILVILAGPFMNIVAALLIMIAVFSIAGVDRIDLSPELYVADVTQSGPAYVAGLEDGDVFIDIAGIAPKGDMDILTNSFQNKDGVDVTVNRDGEIVDLFLVPRYEDETQTYKVDISVSARYQREKVSFPMAIKEGTLEVIDMTKTLIVFLGKLVFTGEGAKDVGSIVGAVAIMSDVAQQVDIYYFLYILAFISINLGIFNLLPIPPFDGFKIGMYLFEGIRGKKISLDTQMKINVAGFVLIIALSALLIYRDIARLIAG